MDISEKLEDIDEWLLTINGTEAGIVMEMCKENYAQFSFEADGKRYCSIINGYQCHHQGTVYLLPDRLLMKECLYDV